MSFLSSSDTTATAGHIATQPTPVMCSTNSIRLLQILSSTIRPDLTDTPGNTSNEIKTGYATPLPGNGTIPADVPTDDPDQALLMGLAERADVIVDFRGLEDGTVVRMINTAPDEPFGGFDGEEGEEAVADPATSGQIMQFRINKDLNGASDTDPAGDTPATPPHSLLLHAEPALPEVDYYTRRVSLNERESEEVCVLADSETEEFVVPIRQVDCGLEPDPGFEVVPFGPTEALLGTVGFNDTVGAFGIPLKWTDRSGTSFGKVVTLGNGLTEQEVTVYVSENPGDGATEVWEIYNFTADAHPIHLHLVRFEVIERTPIPNDEITGFNGIPYVGLQPWESGYKDTVIAYPCEITKVRAHFDIEGLYFWHCHIVEHEDNEIMRPYAVGLEDAP